MKHAGPTALERLDPLLKQLRKREGLTEKSRGCFYRGGRGFLHFHEHGMSELYADISRNGTFVRLPSTTAAERRALLILVDRELAIVPKLPEGHGAKRRNRVREI
jgi:hypothetical protein